jgi:hypothetical protein
VNLIGVDAVVTCARGVEMGTDGIVTGMGVAFRVTGAEEQRREWILIRKRGTARTWLNRWEWNGVVHTFLNALRHYSLTYRKPH